MEEKRAEMIPPTEELKEEKQSKPERKRQIERPDNNLTMSTQLSTDQLICKSPNDSSNPSIHSNTGSVVKEDSKKDSFNLLLSMGLLQVLFGVLMVVFGVLVIVHGSSLSQVNFILYLIYNLIS